MKFLLLFSFVAIGHCALLGREKCTYGPSYWCSHLHHAKECSAFQHCLTTVWAKQQPQLVGTTETCFGVVSTLDQVRSGDQADLLSRMAMSCTHLEDKERTRCKELMKNDEEEVLVLLKSELPSTAVASALGFCDGFSDTVPHPGQRTDVQMTGDYCKDCTNFFGDIREIFNKSEAEVVNYVKNLLCPQLGSLEDLCNQLVDQYAGVIINTIDQQLNPQDICFMMQMCKNQSRAALMERMKVGSNFTCSLCENGAKSIQDALRDPKLQKEIENDVKNILCPLLPGKLALECKTYVDAYAPLAFQLMVVEFDPESFCQMMSFCSKQTEQPRVIHLDLGSAGTKVAVAPSRKEESGPDCVLCEFVMKELTGLLKKNATQEEIEVALDRVCSVMPASVKTECTDFVNKYAPMIINMLLAYADPGMVCKEIGLCTAGASRETVPVKVLAPPRAGSVECELCTVVITYVNEGLKDNTKTIVDLLEEACDAIPDATVKAECQNLVSTYGPAIINILVEEDDPSKVCSGLGLCASVKSESESELNDSRAKSGAPLLFVPMSEVKPARPGMVGRKRCTQGPAFWCASKENAKHCNIPLEHCETKYGMKINA